MQIQKCNNKKNLNSSGFTLLELLVVVFIVGILTGIALPQYRKTVGKAELAQVISAIKAVHNAEDRYFLVNDAYATSFNDLDIDLPNNNVRCTIATNYALCNNKNYVIAHFHSQSQSYKNRLECYARTEKLKFACDDFIGKPSTLSTNGPCTYIGGNPCWGISKTLPM